VLASWAKRLHRSCNPVSAICNGFPLANLMLAEGWFIAVVACALERGSLLLLGGSAAATAQLAAACEGKLSKEATQILQPGRSVGGVGGA
jgi:hypothetical protein